MDANARTWLGRISRTPLIFALAVIAAVALLGLSEVAYRRAMHDVQALRMQEDARAAGQWVLTCLAEAESGEQAYLRTGRAPDVTHPHACQKDFEARLFNLSADPQADAASARATLAPLQALVQARFAAPLDDTARRQRSAALRAGAQHLVARQAVAAQALRSDLAEVLWLHRVGIVAMVLMSLLAVAVVQRQSATLVRQREQQRRAVQAERDQLEQQVVQRTAELTELTHHLEWAAEEARARLAGTLHDDWGAVLTAAKLDAARLKARLGNADPEAAARLAHLTAALTEVIMMKRRLIEELRPSSLQHLGLVPALEGLLAEVRQRSGLVVEASLVRLPLAPDVALTAYRLVQEALDNVQRHAGAQRVWVRLAPDAPGTAWLEVRDDGRGFDPTQRRAAWHGLVGLRYRVQAVQGRWLLEAAPGAGTRVAAGLPLAGPGPVVQAVDSAAPQGACQPLPTGAATRH